MSFLDDVKAVGDHLAQILGGLDADPLVQAALTTTLGPAGKTVVNSLITALEAHEAAHEADKQAAVATAYQQGRSDQASESGQPEQQ